MRGNHVCIRNSICGWIVLAALALLSLSANAGKLPDFKGIGASKSGNTYTLGPTGQGTAWGSTIPVNKPIGGGWEYAGNYGVPTTATGPTMTMSANGNVFFAGTKYPFQAGYTVNKSAVLTGLGGLATLLGGWPAVIGAGAIAIGQWMDNANVRVNPTSGALQRRDTSVCSVAPCYRYRPYNGPANVWHTTRTAACHAAIAIINAGWSGGGSGQIQDRYHSDEPGVCYSQRSFNYGSTWGAPTPVQNIEQQSIAPVTDNWLPASMDDIAPYMQSANMPGGVVQEILDKGGSIDLGTPTLTGPGSVQGDTKEVQNPDGTRSVSTTNYNFTTTGNTITFNNATTTTNHYNSSNVQTGTTTTTDTPAADKDDRTECEKNPDSLNCSDLDTPEGEIPRDNVTITYEAENLFGDGSCPADLTANMITLGHTVKVWNWTKTCELALPLRALIMSLAAFAAFLIVMPSEVRV